MSATFSKLDSSIDEMLGYQLRRVSSLAMATLADELRELDLQVVSATVLAEIAENPEVTSSEIGRALGIKRANMTPLIATLSARGYINSTAKDGRSQALSLTREGWCVYERSQAIIIQHDQHFFAMLSDTDREQLSRILKNIWKKRRAHKLQK